MGKRDHYGTSKRAVIIKTVENAAGEIQSTTSVSYLPSETGYVKFYETGFEVIGRIRSVPFKLLIEMGLMSTFPNGADDPGGMLHLSSRRRKDLAEKCGIGTGRLNNIITELVKADFMVRAGWSMYLINPAVCGKTRWVDIAKADGIYREIKIRQISCEEPGKL